MLTYLLFMGMMGPNFQNDTGLLGLNTIATLDTCLKQCAIIFCGLAGVVMAKLRYFR